jgi:hypothetical protein
MRPQCSIATCKHGCCSCVHTSWRSARIGVRARAALVRSAPGGVKKYAHEDVTICLFRQLHAMIAEELDQRDEYDKDVWNLEARPRRRY